MLKKRKGNRLKGYDYSRNNLYFITNCVKNNACCLGRVVRVGIGRDLSIQYRENNPKNSSEDNSMFQSQNISVKKYISELNQFGLIVEERINWLSNQYEYVEIHNYVVMPNHFHLILEIDSSKAPNNEVKIKSVSSLIGALKSTASHQIRELGFHDFEWHRSFHDHIIKTDQAYQNISNYIDKNPDKWFEDKFFTKD